MRVLLIVAVAGIVSAVSPAEDWHRHYPLPKDAKISFGQVVIGEAHDYEKPFCETFSVTERQLRHNFAHWHLVTFQDLHDGYSAAGCNLKGKIESGGKTFHFSLNPSDYLLTDFPDGESKLIGGKHSGNLSGK